MKFLPLKEIVYTSKFGMRIHPITKKKTMHNGVDLKASMNTEVYAVDFGTVILSKWVDGAGECMVIQHSGYFSYYCHLSKRLFEKNKTVSGNTVIAYSGNTGDSTGPHLHLGIARTFNFTNFSKSDWIDPEPEIAKVIAMVPKNTQVSYLNLLFTVKCILLNGENYIRLKDLEDVLHLCGIGWFNNKVTVNGKYVDLNKYSTINYLGENYIRLRDIETIGLAKVQYDATNKRPVITAL